MYAHPEYLVETDWLAEHLDDADLRVFDCSVFLTPSPDGTFDMESGRAKWESGHIPGSGFLDLISDLSDTSSALRFTMPGPDAFAQAVGRAGIGNDSRVVLYCGGPPMWATRMWWMLRAMGFDNAAVLNGGWNKWKAEGRPQSTTTPAYPPSQFDPRPRPDMFAPKEEVLAGTTDGGTCVLNTLTPQMHSGEMAIASRPGRISGSTNVPAAALSDPDNHTFLDADTLQGKLDAGGASAGKRVITYCGGGIAATQNAFALALLGHENVAVYDGSMSEWAADPDMPMETG